MKIVIKIGFVSSFNIIYVAFYDFQWFAELKNNLSIYQHVEIIPRNCPTNDT